MKTRTCLARAIVLTGGVFAIGSAVVANDIRLDTKVVPTFESIRLDLDADSESYSGSVSVDLEVKQPARTFQFHAEGQELTRVELRHDEESIDLKTERGKDGVVTVAVGRELAPGSYSLHVDFTNRFSTDAMGLYRMVQDGQGYLFSQFEAVEARRAFPCWDEPHFKIPFQMTLRVPQGDTAVSNTPVEQEKTADGFTTFVFRKTKPMPSYLLAIAAGPLESVPIEGMSVPGRVYTVKGQSGLAGLTAEMSPPILAALENYFGQRYPYEKLDLVAVPEYWFGGMENPGLVVCVDAALLVEPGTASTSQKRSLAGLLAHEFAHMWYGDLVTMEWWDDLWLNESFATYMGQKIVAELYPDLGTETSRRRQIQYLMTQDARPSTKPVRGEVEATSEIFEDIGLNYGKGRTVLGMMEQWIGSEAFRKGVTTYLKTHAWGNAVGADLWNALSAASGKDVAGPMSSFLDQSGLPLIEVGIDGDGNLTLSQRRFLNYGVEAPPQSWKVPVRLRYHDGEIVRAKVVMLDGKTATIKVGGKVDWVYPDDGAHGYYRWHVPDAMLVDLAKNAGERLDPSERIAFVGNSAALLDAGLISGGDYLQILNLFADDAQPEVVSAVVSGLGKVESAFISDDRRDAFAAYVRATLGPVLERYGKAASAGEDETVALLRPRLIEWLGDQGEDPEVRAYAVELAKSYMADAKSVDPALAGVALQLAAIGGDRKLFDQYKKRFETAETPVERERYLAALGSFEKPELQRAALDYVLSGPVRPNELRIIFDQVGRTEAAEDLVFEWLLGNYDEVTSRMPTMRVASMPFSARGCSTERLATAQKFFSDPSHRVDGTDRSMTKVTEQVQDCVNLREREGDAVAAYLTGFSD